MKLRIAVAALVLALIGVSAWFSVRIGRQNERIAALERELIAARARPAGPSAPPQVQPAAPAAPVSPSGHTTRQTAAESPTCGDTELLNSKLRDATAALSRLQARTSELEIQADEFLKERQRLKDAEAEAQSGLANLNRSIEKLNSDRAALDSRMKDIESENQKLRLASQANNQKNAQFGTLANELQEVSRRQQLYTTNIQRRYRELTDLFRALPGMLEVKGNGPELSRMQTAISMADEDLRQLNDLSARLGRVQKQIAAAAAAR